MSVVRKLGLAILGAVYALALAIFWAIGTESGTRFILSKVPLPAELELDEVGGTLLRGIQARSVTWNSGDLLVRVQGVEADIAVSRLVSGHVRIQALTVDAIEVRTEPSGDAAAAKGLPEIGLPITVSIGSSSLRNIRLRVGSFERDIDELRVAAAMHGSQLRDVDVSLQSTWLNADLEGSVHTSGAWPADLTLRWAWIESAAGRLEGTLSLQGDSTRYAVQHSLQKPLALATTGHVSGIDNDVSFDLENNWDALVWEKDRTRLQSPAGTLHLAGTLDSVNFVLQTELGLNDLPFSTIAAEGSLDTAARGFDLTYDISGVDPSARNEVLNGTLGSSGTARGRLVDGELEADIHIASLHGDINGHAVAGSGNVSYTRDVIRMTQTNVRIGSNTFLVEGSLGEELSVAASLDLPEVNAILPGASGTLTANLDIGGDRGNPSIRLRGSGSDLTWSDLSTGRLEFGGTGTPDRHVLRASMAAAQGNVDIEARGGLGDHLWSGHVTRLDIAQQLAGEWRLVEDASITLAAERIAVTNLCLQRVAEAGKACTTLDMGPGGATNFDAAIEKLPLAALPWTPPLGIDVSGFSDVRATGSYADRRLSGELVISLEDARIESEVDNETISAVFDHAGGRVTVTDNALHAVLEVDLERALGTTALELAVADVFEPTSTIVGEGNVAINDLSLLAVFVPDITNPRGLLSGRLLIDGTLAEPEFTGNLAATDVSFGIRRAGIEISGASVQLAQSGPGRLRFDGRARSGDGDITIEGDTRVSTAAGIRSRVHLRGQNFELLRLPDWQVAASPDIVAVFDDRKTEVAGVLAVPLAKIRARELPQTARSASPDTVVHRSDRTETSDRRRLDVDVNAVLGDDVQISAFGLTTGLTGAVQLQGGSHDAFKGYGRLTLQGGRYKAYGQDLDIERGELIFNGPLDNPQLDVRAIRRMTDVVAGIRLSGTPRQLRSTVFSEPALSEAEALSYLLTGRPLANASGSDDSDMLNAAAFALGVSGAGSIVSEIRAGLGLETLAIEGGPDDGRLIAGKRFGDRLLVEYGYGLVDKLGTLLLRYRLNKRLTLESRTGTVSNFDIVYSIKKQ